VPPKEMTRAKDLERHGTGNRPPYPDPPAGSSSTKWLDEFMLREGIVRDPSPVLGYRQRLGRPHDEKRDAAYEPMPDDDETTVRSRHFPVVIGVAALLAVLGLGGLAYGWIVNSSVGAAPQAAGVAFDQPTRRSEPVAARLPPPKPMRSPAPSGGHAEPAKRTTERALPLSKTPSATQHRSIDLALFRGGASALWGDTAAGFPGYPQQAFGRPANPLSDGVAALMVAAVTSGVARADLVEKATSPWGKAPPTLKPAAVTPAPLTESGPEPVVPKLAKPQTAQPPATPPARNQLASGPTIHLQIVYASWGPQSAKTIAALQARLKGQLMTIATSGASAWPVRHELVVYFFPGDRAAANLVAASLAQITKRTAPVMLLRTKSAPQPGTVDILLPLHSGEDLRNDNL
jgi:hypothetical protein